MWYRISRNDYAKYQLFSNFDEISTDIFRVVSTMNETLEIAREEYKKESLSGKSPNPYYEYAIVEQAKDDFGTKKLESESLNLNIPITGVMASAWGHLAEYDNSGSININLQSHLLRKVKTKNDISRILAHELQHAVEHYYQKFSGALSDKEKDKSKKWSDSAEQKMTQQGQEPLRLTRYYNEPTEVRARLVETLLHYGLPSSQLDLREKMLNNNTYTAYQDMISAAISPDIFEQLSKEAIDYMVKELYKAIWD